MLLDQPVQIQRWVVCRGSLRDRDNPSSTLVSRIGEATSKYFGKCPYDLRSNWICIRCGKANAMSVRCCGESQCEEPRATSAEYQALNEDPPDEGHHTREDDRTRSWVHKREPRR